MLLATDKFLGIIDRLCEEWSTGPSCMMYNAKVAELVDALDLGSCGVTRESSSLSFRTISWTG